MPLEQLYPMGGRQEQAAVDVEVISVTASSGYDANTGEVVDEKELPSTVTLLVTTEQAKVLAELEQDSELHLALVYSLTQEIGRF